MPTSTAPPLTPLEARTTLSAFCSPISRPLHSATIVPTVVPGDFVFSSLLLTLFLFREEYVFIVLLSFILDQRTPNTVSLDPLSPSKCVIP